MALSLRRRPKTLSRHQCRRIVRLLHRSCPLSFCGLENSRRLPGIRSSTAQLLHSGVLHVYLASFVFGAKCAPLPTTAAFSSPAMDCTPPPFSSPGVAKTGHPLSFGDISFSTGGVPSLTLGLGGGGVGPGWAAPALTLGL